MNVQDVVWHGDTPINITRTFSAINEAALEITVLTRLVLRPDATAPGQSPLFGVQ